MFVTVAGGVTTWGCGYSMGHKRVRPMKEVEENAHIRDCALVHFDIPLLSYEQDV